MIIVQQWLWDMNENKRILMFTMDITGSLVNNGPFMGNQWESMFDQTIKHGNGLMYPFSLYIYEVHGMFTVDTNG
jgi:hypothetical protein